MNDFFSGARGGGGLGWGILSISLRGYPKSKNYFYNNDQNTEEVNNSRTYTDFCIKLFQNIYLILGAKKNGFGLFVTILMALFEEEKN